MDYWFRYALAAGFIALPISLFAGDHGLSGGPSSPPQKGSRLDEFKQRGPQLTSEQKEKFKAALNQMQQEQQKHREQYSEKKAKVEQLQKEVQDKIQQHRQEMESKVAGWKQNHPNDQPSAGHKGEQEKRHAPPGGGHGVGHKK